MSDPADADATPRAPSPVDRLLDAGVFVPLGFLLKRDEVVQDLAAAGRKQIAFSRSLGRAALRGLTKARQAPAQAPKTADAAVVGYESMTARELITTIPTLTAEQLTRLRTQETEGKNRVTVVRAIDAALRA